jgi:hypothetical protein
MLLLWYLENLVNYVLCNNCGLLMAKIDLNYTISVFDILLLLSLM